MFFKGTVGKSEWITEWINSSIPTRCALERGDGPTSPSCGKPPDFCLLVYTSYMALTWQLMNSMTVVLAELVNIRKPGNRVSLDLQQNRLVNVTDVKMNSEDASLVIDSQLAQVTFNSFTSACWWCLTLILYSSIVLGTSHCHCKDSVECSLPFVWKNPFRCAL